jgi:hypothetical protein
MIAINPMPSERRRHFPFDTSISITSSLLALEHGIPRAPDR